MTKKFNEYDELLDNYLGDCDQVRIVENHNIMYKKYRHRAIFYIPDTTKNDQPRYFYGRIDWKKADDIKKSLRKKANFEFRSQINYYNARVIVYFSSLADFLSLLNSKIKNDLTELSLMSKNVIDEYNEFDGEFRTILRVRKNLPYKKYRYKVYTVNSYYTKRNISQSNLEAALLQLENFPGIRLSSRFKDAFLRQRSYYDNFFYAENLDWLPMMLLIDNRIIKTIEKYKTKEEVNESTNI